MFGHSRCDQIIALLRAEVADLRSELSRVNVGHREERQKLLDRILALTSPNALHQVTEPLSRKAAPNPNSIPPRIHWPGTDFSRGTAADPKKNPELMPPDKLKSV